MLHILTTQNAEKQKIQMDFDFDNPIYIARPSVVRRTLSVGMQAVLGVLLIEVALNAPSENNFWSLILMGCGLLALLAALFVWQSTKHGIVLRKEGIFQESGDIIVSLDEITSIDRGVFSFKPSNGFLIRLRRSQPWKWVPGLWWRIGARVGIGGLLPSAQTRVFADTLSAMVDARDRV